MTAMLRNLRSPKALVWENNVYGRFTMPGF